jgi:hypothetical protein
VTKGQIPPPGWTPVDKNADSVFSPTTRELGGGKLFLAAKGHKFLLSTEDLGGIHSIGAPIQTYPLYENGFRAARRQSPEENAVESSQLYAEFAQVASRNPMAWNYGKEPATPKLIRTVTKRNRMICLPCKAMRSQNSSHMLRECRSSFNECIQHR